MNSATNKNDPACLNAAATRLVGARIAELESQKAELLAALRELIDMVTDSRCHGPEIDAACAAIAKAEGRAQ